MYRYHGTINVVTALEKSCNIFFYETGRRMGIDMIAEYASRYGLGSTNDLKQAELQDG
jgi:penicillin-binding protein 2